jgi:hypothetical protein
MRGRMWRRYISECYHLKRMKRWSGFYWYKFTDINGIKVEKPLWIDGLGLQHINILKHTRTRKWDTRHKRKWGKKGKRNFDYSSDYYTRVKDKVRFQKELRQEYGY